MSIFIHKDSRVVVQGVTGKEGAFWAKHMKDMGTQVVFGVTPGKEGQDVDGIPVYHSVRRGIKDHPADVAMLFVPPKFTKDAVFEALDAGIKKICTIADGIPLHEAIQIRRAALSCGAMVVGGNTSGIISVGEAMLGTIPYWIDRVYKKGHVGVMTRSGSLTNEVTAEIVKGGFGVTTLIGVGGDPVPGTRFAELLPLYEADPDTHAVVIIGELGGTGATFIVPIIFLLFMRSKQLKAVGKASVVPVMFAVNEPLLFAAPIILNPYFLIPFLFAPVANVLIGKFFIDFLGMNGFIYAMPWALPGPIGTFIDTNFQPISLVLVVVLLVVDFLIYYPFCKAYDNVLCKQEAETLAEEEAEETKAVKTAAAPAVEAPVVETASATEASAAPSALKGKDLRVLVLCAGAGTSALLANALKEGADELGIDITANAGAYGSHYAIMDQYNVIVLAPQVRTYYNEMKADTDRLGITLLSPKGKQYIDLTKDPKGAVAWIEENLEA